MGIFFSFFRNLFLKRWIKGFIPHPFLSEKRGAKTTKIKQSVQIGERKRLKGPKRKQKKRAQDL